MTPSEKAKELVEKFTSIQVGVPSEGICVNMDFAAAKQCALICVEEMIKEEDLWLDEVGYENGERFWPDVKAEIEKL